MNINSILENPKVAAAINQLLMDAQDVVLQSEGEQRRAEMREFIHDVLNVSLAIATYAVKLTKNPFDDIAVNSLKYSGLAHALLDEIEKEA